MYRQEHRFSPATPVFRQFDVRMRYGAQILHIYIWTFDGFVYLTSIIDLYSRKIIAWELSSTLEAKWLIKAVEKAKKNRHVTRPLIMYSDRGYQYTSADYMDATEGMTP